MAMKSCLYCYGQLADDMNDFHPRCAKKIFGSNTAPILLYTKNDIQSLAEQIVRSQTTFIGLQVKLSFDIEKYR